MLSLRLGREMFESPTNLGGFAVSASCLIDSTFLGFPETLVHVSVSEAGAKEVM